jgi:hypothetical protein
MSYETLEAVSPWSWFSGALQQYQTAFLLLAEIFTYPGRREADRIWAVLDYVFETPPGLNRDQKARYILTEIRDKMDMYRNARKFKAPTAMFRRLGQGPPRSVADVAANRSLSSPKAVPIPEIDNADGSGPPKVGSAQIPDDISNVENPPRLLFPAPGGEIHAPVQLQSPPETVSSPVSSAGHATQGSSSDNTSMFDELMADIDWVSGKNLPSERILTKHCRMNGTNYFLLKGIWTSLLFTDLYSSLRQTFGLTAYVSNTRQSSIHNRSFQLLLTFIYILKTFVTIVTKVKATFLCHTG